jgi:hypothetical protein
MNPLQIWGSLVVAWLTIIGSIVGAIVYQTHYIDKRIEDFKASIDKQFAAIDKRLDDLKDFIRSEVRRLEDKIEHIEHPVVKP